MNNLKLFNSLSKEKQSFKPLKENEIGLYVCGVTVYDYCHLGHARVFLVFDTIVRHLRHRGWQVRYVQNITDIDDKIIKRAQENDESTDDLTTRFIEYLHEDLNALNVLPPDIEPRATQFMPQMVKIIENLISNEVAYVGTTGDVYYDVSKFERYGCLAHRQLEDLQAGARVEIDSGKRNPLDFVLWKMSKPGEPAWPSPWGEGRPGWHIECSAMSMDCLGHNFDIHGGGNDLKFPHHENEIAQSEAATGKTFANYWMHLGFLEINKEKMSKSLGNFFTIRDVLKQVQAEELRYFMIASHYRSPVEYSSDSIESAKGALTRFYTALRGITIGDKPLANTEFEQKFNAAMDDDFNTPEALAVLFDMAREINKQKESNTSQAEQLAATLKHLAGSLGLLEQDPETYLKGGSDLDEAKINTLIEERNKARVNKDYATSDKIRDQLLEQGITLEDTAEGTLWRKN